jgi:protoporphyrinogen oxidase
VDDGGGRVQMRQEAARVEREGFRVKRVISRGPDGEEAWEGDQFLSSMPLTLLVKAMSPAAPDEVIAAANALTFRNLLTVDLIVDHPDLFPDNWVYVHEPRLQLGRLQNFKNWSPYMVPDATKTSLGLEYFCWDTDAIWRMTTEELVALGTAEMRQTGLLRGAPVLDGTVVRVPRAYPVYRRGYERHLQVVSDWIRRFENLQTMGRYGMFKYNNADHSMLTALLSVENLFGARHDVWRVNTDTGYHEVRSSGEGEEGHAARRPTAA